VKSHAQKADHHRSESYFIPGRHQKNAARSHGPINIQLKKSFLKNNPISTFRQGLNKPLTNIIKDMNCQNDIKQIIRQFVITGPKKVI
jgi:hypothetical protein